MPNAPARIAFAGTPEFAAASLAALIAGGHEIVCVHTQPDRPAGRGRQLKPSPVKELALAHGLPVLQPLTLRNPADQAALAAFLPDLMIVAAYGLLLPATVLRIPRLGCINVHASLLPRWRGAAPIERAIEAGDTLTGITIMQMDEGLDTGGMLLRRECPILDSDTGGSLRERLQALGAEALMAALPGILEGTAVATAQDGACATYAAKLRKEEAALDWELPAAVLARRVRAFNPANTCHAGIGGETLRIHAALPVEDAPAAPPGTVLRTGTAGILVACGEGALLLTALQPAGGRAMTAAELLNGRAKLFTSGSRFG
jgi:methionyl-tRNA formyltransferase